SSASREAQESLARRGRELYLVCLHAHGHLSCEANQLAHQRADQFPRKSPSLRVRGEVLTALHTNQLQTNLCSRQLACRAAAKDLLAVRHRETMRSMRSFQVLLLVLGGLILPVAGGVAYWGYRTSPNQMLRRGLAQLDQGLTEEAAAMAQSLEERGHSDQACLLRGEIWRRSGLALASSPAAENTSEAALSPPPRDAFSRALAEFSRIKAPDPLALNSQVLGAECLVRLGERRLATEALLAVVSRKPEHKEAHRWLAAIYIDLNSADRAIEHLRAWGELEPANGRPYRWIGLFCKDAKRPDEAIAAYQ